MQALIFNRFTFDWPVTKQVFYFSLEETKNATRIHKSIFPTALVAIFPNAQANETEYIYTTFAWQQEGFIAYPIDLKTENPDFVKSYFNQRLTWYFRKKMEQVVRVGFVKENQIWLPVATTTPDQSWTEYEKYSLVVNLCEVSNFPELQLSFDGRSKVLKKNVFEAILTLDPEYFNLVVLGHQVVKYSKLADWDWVNYEEAFPVMGKKLKAAMGIPITEPSKENRYKSYEARIEHFFKTYLNTPDFKEVFPLRESGFLPVPVTLIGSVNKESNLLQFGRGVDTVPYNGMKYSGPFQKPPFNRIYLFFILHVDNKDMAAHLKTCFETGLDYFKGFSKYVEVTFHTIEKFSIVFKNLENPLPEIEEALDTRTFNPEHRYIAIYLTPFNKFDTDLQKREIYYKVKELLLIRSITSQCIDPVKASLRGKDFVYSLPNIAVAILAKLQGIPWKLNTPAKNELIVGIGAFKHLDRDVQYIGSAFSFTNTGNFNRFEYFMQSEVEILAGSIARAVREFTSIYQNPDRLIIHFYKTMSEKELAPIRRELDNLGLDIPVFIITINKTESEDIVIFDKGSKELMPMSGTFVNIGKNRYLLCNNTRYSESEVPKATDGFPFPIKLKVDCTHPELMSNPKTVQELIDQVYQFSRIYWKSVKQQNLPVTIKYPEMVAQIAPHFVGADIPDFGKDNLWFL